MKVSFKVRGIQAVQSFLASVPRGATRVALEAFSDYLLGNERRGLRHNEPYKYVSRKSAYGVTFFTPKQKRWFFWALKTGQIDPGSGTRTGKTSAAWKAEPSVNGYQMKITNDTPGGYYTRDDKGQARQPAKVGWRKVSQVLTDNYLGAIRAAVQAVNKWLTQKK
jgi:hypothetical protein